MRRSGSLQKSTSVRFMAVLSGEGNGGCAAERVDEGDAARAQAVAGAVLDDDVPHLVLLGDPYRALHGAHGAAGAVDHFEGLVGPEVHSARLEFDLHTVLLAFTYAQDASLRLGPQTVKMQL